MPRSTAFFVARAATVGCAASAQAAVTVTIDKSIQQMTVEVDGRPLYQWPVSTGKAAGYDTPSGKYKAFRMERDHFSKEWDDAPMPFSIFFTQKGHAIHGSYDVKRLGTPASHGCVRLAPANAQKLFALVEQEGVLNTTVVLTGTTPSGAPAVARRRLPRPDEVADPYAQPQYGSSRNIGHRYGTDAAGLWQSALRTAAGLCAAELRATAIPTPRNTAAAIRPAATAARLYLSRPIRRALSAAPTDHVPAQLTAAAV